jgi:hypothetical protein
LNFGKKYSKFPTVHRHFDDVNKFGSILAAAVFVIAMKYQTEVDLVATSLVLCTFISVT